MGKVDFPTPVPGRVGPAGVAPGPHCTCPQGTDPAGALGGHLLAAWPSAWRPSSPRAGLPVPREPPPVETQCDVSSQWNEGKPCDPSFQEDAGDR